MGVLCTPGELPVGQFPFHEAAKHPARYWGRIHQDRNAWIFGCSGRHVCMCSAMSSCACVMGLYWARRFKNSLVLNGLRSREKRWDDVVFVTRGVSCLPSRGLCARGAFCSTERFFPVPRLSLSPAIPYRMLLERETSSCIGAQYAGDPNAIRYLCYPSY